MNLRETAVHRARVEVSRIHAVGIKSAGVDESPVEQSLIFSFEIVHQHGNVVESFFTGSEHVTVNRRCVVVLLDELDHHVAEVTKGIRDISFLISAAIVKAVSLVVHRLPEGTCTKQIAPFVDGLIEIVDEVSFLKEGIAGDANTEAPDSTAVLPGRIGRHVRSLCRPQVAYGSYQLSSGSAHSFQLMDSMGKGS
jgi:hypothetical protein